MLFYPRFPLILVSIFFACTSLTWAQTGVPSAKPASPAEAPVAATAQPGSRSNQLIERIVLHGSTPKQFVGVQWKPISDARSNGEIQIFDF